MGCILGSRLLGLALHMCMTSIFIALGLFLCHYRAQDASIALRLPEFIIAPKMPALFNKKHIMSVWGYYRIYDFNIFISTILLQHEFYFSSATLFKLNYIYSADLFKHSRISTIKCWNLIYSPLLWRNGSVKKYKFIPLNSKIFHLGSHA